MIYKDPITGLDVCDECECSIENGKCLCDMSGSIDKNWCLK